MIDKRQKVMLFTFEKGVILHQFHRICHSIQQLCLFLSGFLFCTKTSCFFRIKTLDLNFMKCGLSSWVGNLIYITEKTLNWEKTGENKSFQSCSGLLNYFCVLEQSFFFFFLIRPMISSKPSAAVTCWTVWMSRRSTHPRHQAPSSSTLLTYS